MIIVINGEYRIAADECQWIVQYLPRQKKKDRQNPRWRNLGYFESLDSAIVYLAHRRIRLLPGTWEGVDALPALCATLDTIKQEILGASRKGGGTSASDDSISVTNTNEEHAAHP